MKNLYNLKKSIKKNIKIIVQKLDKLQFSDDVIDIRNAVNSLDVLLSQKIDDVQEYYKVRRTLGNIRHYLSKAKEGYDAYEWGMLSAKNEAEEALTIYKYKLFLTLTK